ncbi:prolyl-tRNA synthetase associated domain-containing protein 1-like [Saccoglossus kowalevskii]|uniref:PrdX deacylase domain-containing protein 1 n=1 Tax=Saccoglossus kowalevskii TaxID=10224 RepID=A0ABM0GV31_SACKO|nr:PREDICTED: prolyl-tRNA synthetase associated domain-containing protein 1-like [Saccoglossus kowalevskii]
MAEVEIPSTSPDNRKMAGKEEIIDELKRQGYDIEVFEHPEVFTVETMMPYVGHLPGVHTKNFFLKDKKKKGLWLMTVKHDREVNLGKISKEVGAPGGLRFADESIMLDKIGVGQGCVTPIALYNDKNKDVKFILDSDIINGGHERMYCHPMVNSATIGIKPEDFKSFIESTGHSPILLNF